MDGNIKTWGYLSIPPTDKDFDRESLKEELSILARPLDLHEIVEYKDLNIPPQGAGFIPEAFGNWVLNLDSTKLMLITSWFLTTYATKEFLKGFSSQAGKDTWEGVKKLYKKIKVCPTTPVAVGGPKPQLKIVAADKDLILTAHLDLEWENSELWIDSLERKIMPCIAKTFSAIYLFEPKDEFQERVKSESELRIYPCKTFENTWLIQIVTPNVEDENDADYSYLILECDEMKCYFDPGDGGDKAVAARLIKSFSEMSFIYDGYKDYIDYYLAI